MSPVAMDPKEWRNLPIASLTDLWLFDNRSSEIELDYQPLEGGFIPAVPKWLMLRFTKPGWLVYDPMAGAMTTARVGDKIARDVISLDIECRGDPEIDPMYRHLMIGDARTFRPSDEVDMVIWHPPYWQAVRFTDNEADLSGMAWEEFWVAAGQCIWRFDEALKPGRICAIVIGNVYHDGRVLPLPALLYNHILTAYDVDWRLKGWVVKNIEGNRQADTGLWLFRSCNADSFLFKHEVIQVWQKGE